MPKIKTPCCAPGCRRSSVARGMCRLHYRRWWNQTPAGDRPATTATKGRPRKNPTAEMWKAYTLKLPPHQMRAIQAVARQTGKSQSALVAEFLRRAIPDPQQER